MSVHLSYNSLLRNSDMPGGATALTAQVLDSRFDIQHRTVVYMYEPEAPSGALWELLRMTRNRRSLHWHDDDANLNHHDATASESASCQILTKTHDWANFIIGFLLEHCTGRIQVLAGSRCSSFSRDHRILWHATKHYNSKSSCQWAKSHTYLLTRGCSGFQWKFSIL